MLLFLFDGIETCRELGIGIVPYSPLGRGFFGGKAVVESLPENSFLVKKFCLFYIDYLSVIYLWRNKIFTTLCFS